MPVLLSDQCFRAFSAVAEPAKQLEVAQNGQATFGPRNDVIDFQIARVVVSAADASPVALLDDSIAK